MTLSASSSQTPASNHPAAEHLPVGALLVLAMTGFTAIITETLPAGLLPQIAGDLEVTQGLAGQLVTLYAAGSLLAAIPLTALAQRWRRRPTLLAAIIGFLLANTATALSSNYPVTLLARFGAGVAAGLAWGILAGYARRMVIAPLQGRALAIAMVGTPIALSAGVPVATFLGTTFGWRAAFLVFSATTLVLLALVMLMVPDFAGDRGGQRVSARDVFRMPGIRPVLAVIFAWMTAHNLLYTYIAPIASRAGCSTGVALLLLGFGVAALGGIVAIGMLVDRFLRPLILSSLATFAVIACLLAIAGGAPTILVGSVLVWGLSFGGAATLLQTAIGDAAGRGVDLANAMVTTVWNTAIAAGGLAGGVMLGAGGPRALAWGALLLILVAYAIASGSRRHGFTPGPRQTGAPRKEIPDAELHA